MPMLQESKMNEVQALAYMKKPDISILNETWLKGIVDDNEILHSDAYKIFRCNRSPKSHPPDPNNPKRFRKNGGGVLIAVSTNLDVNVRRMNIDCKAEILTIEIGLKNKTKFYITVAPYTEKAP
jgi:hypothetical protein